MYLYHVFIHFISQTPSISAQYYYYHKEVMQVNIKKPTTASFDLAMSFCIYHVALGAVSDVDVSDGSLTSSGLTLSWMAISMTSSNFRDYRVFYLPVSGPYGPIMASNRRKRQSSARPGELTMDFNEASGTLTNLNGLVTSSIQVAAVTTFNDDEVIGDRSAVIERTTLEGGKQNLLLWICISLTYHYSAYCSSRSKLQNF